MEINLPDLEEVVCMAIPHEPKDCIMMRGRRLNRRERLKEIIRAYAINYHLKMISENEPKGLR